MRLVAVIVAVLLTIGSALGLSVTFPGPGGVAGGGGVPPPPAGYAYIINADGAYILNADGAYIVAKLP